MSATHLEDLTDRVKPRSASNLLLWFVVGFVVIFFTWAYFAELDRTVRGMGRVIPSSQLQVVSNLEGGIVEAILVRAGQQVRAGDPLIQRLNQELKGRTLVLITHRPPLLQLVQRIILLDRGKVVTDGPRDTVLRQITAPKAA